MSDRSEAAVCFDHVSKSFGEKRVLADVSFKVQPGQALCILGRSGMGKSVTFKLCIALLKPDQGRIWIEGGEISQMTASQLSGVRRKMGFLFQDAALFDSLTLYENLALPMHRLTKRPWNEINDAVDRALAKLDSRMTKRRCRSSFPAVCASVPA